MDIYGYIYIYIDSTYLEPYYIYVAGCSHTGKGCHTLYFTSVYSLVVTLNGVAPIQSLKFGILPRGAPKKIGRFVHRWGIPVIYFYRVGSSSGPGPRARAGMGPVGGARVSPRGPVEPASPRSPVRSSTLQYFVVLCSTK